jgi:hypothetical protein
VKTKQRNNEWIFKNKISNYYYSYNFYSKFIQNLYYEKGEGEMSVFVDTKNSNKLMLVTVIDISTLYQEKRGKAFDMMQNLFQIRD